MQKDPCSEFQCCLHTQGSLCCHRSPRARERQARHCPLGLTVMASSRTVLGAIAWGGIPRRVQLGTCAQDQQSRTFICSWALGLAPRLGWPAGPAPSRGSGRVGGSWDQAGSSQNGESLWRADQWAVDRGGTGCQRPWELCTPSSKLPAHHTALASWSGPPQLGPPTDSAGSGTLWVHWAPTRRRTSSPKPTSRLAPSTCAGLPGNGACPSSMV